MNMQIKVLAAALFLPLAALAAEAPDFKTLDKDKDGYLSRDEVRDGIPQVLTVFDKNDTNKDGKLNPAEYEMALRVLSGQQS
jgi:Ca2+-binding EF-hand superfamily protein